MPQYMWGQVEGENLWNWQEDLKEQYGLTLLSNRAWESFWQEYGDAWAAILMQRVNNRSRVRFATSNPGAKSPSLKNLDYSRGCFWSGTKPGKGWWLIDDTDLRETWPQVGRTPGKIKQLMNKVLTA